MKKYLLISAIVLFVLAWCMSKESKGTDINTISDLGTLQDAIFQISQDMHDWTLSLPQAQDLVESLQTKYIELTQSTQQNIESWFDIIQKSFDQQSFTIYSLPLRAKKLGMSEPRDMTIDTSLSSYKIMDASGYTSTILVYKWNYEIAMQQAKEIAQKAHLFVSKNFQDAQSLAKLGTIDYISGLDIVGLSKWIVYVNHDLLETSIDSLLSVSVDKEWILTIEATKYQN